MSDSIISTIVSVCIGIGIGAVILNLFGVWEYLLELIIALRRKDDEGTPGNDGSYRGGL